MNDIICEIIGGPRDGEKVRVKWSDLKAPPELAPLVTLLPSEPTTLTITVGYCEEDPDRPR